MTATPDDWEVAVKAGDTLSIVDDLRHVAARRGTSRWGSGSCGCTTARAATTRSPAPSTRRACSPTGTCPRTTTTAGATDRRSLDRPQDRRRARSTTTIPIGSFEYGAGDLAAKGKIPTVAEGQSITFDNLDADDQSVWHSITACKAPCTASTGVAYPLADADVQFDSGQLGDAGPPTAGRDDVEHADRPRPRDLHLLLPHPPVHARRVPGAAASPVARRRRRPGSSRSRADRRAPRPGVPSAITTPASRQ